MPLSDLHRRVATVALRVAVRHGFALGGGNALIGFARRLDPGPDDRNFADAARGGLALPARWPVMERIGGCRPGA